MRTSITMRYCVLLCVLFGTLAAFVSGCKDTDAVDPDATPFTRFMVIFASPTPTTTRDTIDVLIDDIVLGTGIQYLASTGYLPAPTGSHSLKVRRTRTAASLLSTNFQLDANTNATVFAVDSIAKISVLVVSDTIAIPDTSNAYLRYVQLSPNAPAVDLANRTGTVLFSNRRFKEFTGFTPITIAAASSTLLDTLRVRSTGTTTSLLNIPITFAKRRLYTVYTRGIVGSTASPLGATTVTNN